MLINQSSFTPASEPVVHSFGTIQEGSAEVTIGRDTKRVECSLWVTEFETYYIARGMTGRYRTGSKAWPASVTSYIKGNRAGKEFVSYGRDDRHPKFNKAAGLFFARDK